MTKRAEIPADPPEASELPWESVVVALAQGRWPSDDAIAKAIIASEGIIPEVAEIAKFTNGLTLIEFVAGRINGTVRLKRGRPRRKAADGWDRTVVLAREVNAAAQAARAKGLGGPRGRALRAVAERRGVTVEWLQRCLRTGLRGAPWIIRAFAKPGVKVTATAVLIRADGTRVERPDGDGVLRAVETDVSG